MTNKITISEDVIKELWDIKPGGAVNLAGKDYELVELGEWDDQGKYQYMEMVFKLDGLFYSASISRCGSYFSDYEYGYPDEAFQVQQVEKTVKVWEAI